MKSQLDMLLSIAHLLITEAGEACAYQELEREKDISRLRLSSKTRGLELFTLDLPSLDSCLVSSLDATLLSTSGPLSKRRSKVDPRPAFLWGLWSLVFDVTGRLNVEVDPNAILYLRQILCLGKRLSVDCSPDRITSILENYHGIESNIVPPVLRWDGDDLDFDEQNLSYTNSFGFDDRDRDLFGASAFERAGFYRIADITDLLGTLDFTSRALVAVLGDFNPISGEEFPGAGRFRHGPGAVADMGKDTFKYAFPNWPKKLDSVFPYDWCGSHTIVPERYPSEHEPASRLLAVPKTARGPRLIAAEPVAHQWCQQKIATWMRSAFEHSIVGMFIDLRDQSLSQRLVREASSSRHLATLDLSDASDRLSCRHVESLLRGHKPLLEACHAVRTRWVVDRVNPDKGPEWLRLKKFAAQGSALTFPIQSLFFLACCLAACGAKSLAQIRALEGSVRVYGDDLIVPAHAYARLKLLLTHLGLKVNTEKSFLHGLFRESCGLDCYDGYDVTPLKPKSFSVDTPEQCQALIDTSNNFYKRGFWRVSEYLDSILRDAGFRLPVAIISSGVPSLTSYSGYDITGETLRWNGRLQKWEILMHRLVKPVKRVRQDVSEALLQYFTEAPKPDQKWASGVSRDRRATFAPRWVDLSEVTGGIVPPAPLEGLKHR